MTGIVTEVKRKSPSSMVNRWTRGQSVQRVVADAVQPEESPSPPKFAHRRERSLDLEKIDEQEALEEFRPTPRTTTNLRSTIKSKLHLDELYEKFSRTRDIAGLFQRGRQTMEVEEDHSRDEKDAREMDVMVKDSETVTQETRDSEEEDKLAVLPRSKASQLEADEVESNFRGNACSSPKHSRDEDFQFSFDDFSFIGRQTPTGQSTRAVVPLHSQLHGHNNDELVVIEDDSGCVVVRDGDEEEGEDGKGDGEKRETVVEPRTKPRRLNIGEIGRSASAHPDNSAGIDDVVVGVRGGLTKRPLLSDIGRRFSEMNESSADCEFQGDLMYRQGGSNRSLNQFRPNSMPVSPKPRMLLPAQHRGSTDFLSSGGGSKQRGNSLFREYSTQVRGKCQLV